MAHAAVVVFGLDSLASFNAIPGWLEGLTNCNEQSPSLFLVANKADLACYAIDDDSIQKMANDCGATLHFTSAKTGWNIEHLFAEVAQKFLGAKLQEMDKIVLRDNKDRDSCGC